MQTTRNGTSIRKEHDLLVITRLRDATRYLFQITAKAPQRYRHSFVEKLQSLVLEAAEEIYRANAVRVAENSTAEEWDKRSRHQDNALACLKMTGYVAMIAAEEKCLLPVQYENLAKQLYECERLLSAWMKSDKQRAMQSAENR